MKPKYIEPKANESGMNELHSSCFYCGPGSVKWCLRNGYDPNAKDSRGFTPLIWLCRMYDKHDRERKRIFRALVKYGADLTLEDSIGETALVHARELSSKGFARFVANEYKRKGINM